MAATRKPIKLARKTTSALIVDSLRERFMNREFQESEMIRQDRLAKEYNVSLSPVREALIQLEAEGLLTLVRHRGYAVTALSLDDIRQFYELRALVEVALLEHAIPRLTKLDIDTAQKYHEALMRIYKRGTQTAAWTKINWEFHASLYKPAEKAQLFAVAENTYVKVNRYIHMQRKLQSSVDLARSIEEHGKLLEYCIAKETSKAIQQLRSHLIQAGGDLVGFLQQDKQQS